MLGDALKQIKVLLYERISSPLLGAFILSWCLWNFRFIIVVFSSLPVSDKFNLIDTIIFPSQEVTLLKGLIYPLLTTAFFIYLYPYPAKKVYEFWRARQKDLKEIKTKIEDEEPLTQEETRIIRSELYRLTKEYQEEMAKRDAEITRLRDTYKSLSDKEVQYVPNEHSLFLVQLAELQKYKKEAIHVFSLFKNVTKKPESGIIRDLNKNFSSSKVVAEFILGELTTKDLMSKDYNQDLHEYEYKLTHNGRRTALQLGVGKEEATTNKEETQ